MEDSGLAITIVWALWTNRNGVHHGRLRKAGPMLFSWCKHYLDEYWDVSCSPLKASPHMEVNWSPPRYPLYKINVNGIVFSAQKAASVGVIVRDHEGRFIAVLSKKIHDPFGAIEAEAKAFEVDIIFAKEVGIREFVLEGDSIIIVQALKECSHAISSVAPLIYGMLAKCHEFHNVAFSHV